MTIQKVIEHSRQLCMFGAGSLLHACYEQLVLCLGRKPDVICDNAPPKWGTTINGIRCISPEDLRRRKEGMTVIVTVRQHEQIVRQLHEMEIDTILLACFDSGYYHVRDLQRPAMEPASHYEPASLPDLHGKWTLITGASRGVGRQIAQAMARLGSNIIAHSRSTSHVQDVVDACSEWGVEAVPMAAELSNPVEVEAMLARLDQVTPRIDIVFNNAAIAPYCPGGFWEIPPETYRECYAVNTIAPVRICQRLVPAMIRRGFGRVVNVTTHIQNCPGEMAYAISKAALDKFVHDVAPTLSGSGVMVSLADPGWVRTDAGGPLALHPVETVIPGILLGAVLDRDVNGRRFSAQEYAGLSLQAACRRAKDRMQAPCCKWV
jgi:NAD(P)-dependent dehydrogenase (short-subunit alcohol dehydrogenase family)